MAVRQDITTFENIEFLGTPGRESILGLPEDAKILDAGDHVRGQRWYRIVFLDEETYLDWLVIRHYDDQDDELIAAFPSYCHAFEHAGFLVDSE